MHNGFVFFDEEFAEFVVGAEFESVFVDDEESLAVFCDFVEVTRIKLVELFGEFFKIVNARDFCGVNHFLIKVK